MEAPTQNLPQQNIRVFIVDDHPLVVEGLKSLLADIEGIEVVGAAYDSF
jgi:DNA-binding NarL/FixJ family response regulator